MTTATHPPRLLLLLDGPDFLQADAVPACKEPGVDPELFFPIGDRYSDEGRAVCHRCPLELACGDWAVRSQEPYGLWGGLDPEQRKARRRAWELAT